MRHCVNSQYQIIIAQCLKVFFKILVNHKVKWPTKTEIDNLRQVMKALYNTEVLLNKPSQGSQTIIPELLEKLVICFVCQSYLKFRRGLGVRIDIVVKQRQLRKTFKNVSLHEDDIIIGVFNSAIFVQCSTMRHNTEEEWFNIC